jgi:hypothetical protein
VLLVFAAHCQLPSLAGPEHGRTIPLADIEPVAVTNRDFMSTRPGSRSGLGRKVTFWAYLLMRSDLGKHHHARMV